MANIRVDVDKTIKDGSEIIFLAPCDCTRITGLKVYYPNLNGKEVSSLFVFKDAHGNDLSDADLFAEGAYVKVILDNTNGIAYIQNADTNKYLESRFAQLSDEIATAVNGIIVTIPVSGWVAHGDGTYVNTIPVEQITGSEVFDAYLYGDDNTEEQNRAFSELISIETENGKIIITASEQIDVLFRVLLRGKVDFGEQGVIFIRDLTCSDIGYDNTNSNLLATNLQDAIDEVSGETSQLSNPNLFINGDFQVWQRGNSITIPDSKNGYTADRWRVTIDDTVVSKTSSGNLQISCNTPTYGRVQQFIEINDKMYRLLVGKNLTVSVRFSLNRPMNCRMNFGKQTYEYSVTDVNFNTYSHTFILNEDDIIDYNDGNGKFLLVDVFALDSNNLTTQGDLIEVEWAKIEVGSIATPFVPRLYTEELALCHRYYVSFTGSLGGGNMNGSVIVVLVDLPEEMRVLPTIAQTGWSAVIDNLDESTVKDITIYQFSGSKVVLYILLDAAFPPSLTGYYARLYKGIISFNAEFY